MDSFLGVTLENVAAGLAAKINGDLDQARRAGDGVDNNSDGRIDEPGEANDFSGNAFTVSGNAFEAEVVRPFESADIVLSGTPRPTRYVSGWEED